MDVKQKYQKLIPKFKVLEPKEEWVLWQINSMSGIYRYYDLHNISLHPFIERTKHQNQLQFSMGNKNTNYVCELFQLEQSFFFEK